MDIVTISVILGFAAGITQFAGYVVYNLTANGRINTGSWSIWALAGIVDLVSYFAITGDWVVNILPAVCAACAIATFGYAIARKRFSWPDKTDWAFVGVDGAVTVLWGFGFATAVAANILYQASTMSSFVPMYRGQLNGREKEEKLPWLIWTIAYVLLALAVLLRLKRWEELIYPVSHVIACLIVYGIAVYKLRSPR